MEKFGVSGFDFNSAALELFFFQIRKNPLYKKYCRQTDGMNPSHWTEIPALPVSAFKYHRVASFPRRSTIRTFKTSGTTRGAVRGRHEFGSLRAYDATVKALFKQAVLPDLPTGRRIPIVFLILSTAKNPSSSLSYMGSRVQIEFGAARPFYALGDRGLRTEALTRHLKNVARHENPVLIFSTTFALADYLDFLASKKIRLKLPRGSRILETGGYKGRRTQVARPELVRRAGERLGIPATHVVNEYGMTELPSQFYDLSLRTGRATSVKGIPPWTRVQIVHPATGRPVAKGRRGLIRIYDLANQGSCLAVQTEDEGRLTAGGFEILGRQKGADLRGCSLTFEEMRSLA